MKRLSFLLAAVCLVLALAVPRASADSPVPVTVDDALLGGTSYVADGVTMVPLRNFCAALGGWSVSWSGGGAVAKRDGVTIRAVPGERAMRVNGSTVSLPRAVSISGGVTRLPLRTLCQTLGLTAAWDDGLGGAAVSTGKARSYNETDLYWLSRIISAESQGESLKGQIAVGNVVLNRIKAKEFPDTVKDVVFDTKDGTQFEPVSNKTVYNAPTARSVAAAKAALTGTRVVGNCLYFYAPALSKGTWVRAHRTYYTTIGCHRFYL